MHCKMYVVVVNAGLLLLGLVCMDRLVNKVFFISTDRHSAAEGRGQFSFDDGHGESPGEGTEDRRQETSLLWCCCLLVVPSACRARLAQSVEHETLNLRVVGSSPTLVSRFG